VRSIQKTKADRLIIAYYSLAGSYYHCDNYTQNNKKARRKKLACFHHIKMKNY
jgi:hypothetical protein